MAILKENKKRQEKQNKKKQPTSQLIKTLSKTLN